MQTSGKISEHVKVDVAAKPVSLASNDHVGAFYSMSGFKRALFVFQVGVMAATKMVRAEVVQAKDAVGAAEEPIAGAQATITANTGVTKAQLTANAIADGVSTVTINGVVFTCRDTSPNIDAGEFASGSNDIDACTHLAAVINHLLGKTLSATPLDGTVVLAAREPGEATITLTGGHASIVPSTLEALGYIEIDAAQLGTDFTHVALALTTNGTIVVSGTLIREGSSSGKTSPTQQVAAAKVL